MTNLGSLSVLAALFMLPAIASAATTGDLRATSNPNWPSEITLSTSSDPDSGTAHDLVINITSLPQNGAQYRIVRTTANNNFDYSTPESLTEVGSNILLVPSSGFARTVKIQFSSREIAFNSLEVNGDDAMPPANTPGIGQPISASNYYTPTTNNSDYAVFATLTTPAEGASSQNGQTLVINITYLPPDSTYGIYRTTANGNNFTTPGPLSLGENIITVPAVDFNRTVRILFNNDAIEFDALTVNGIVPVPPTNTPGLGEPISASNYFTPTTNSSIYTASVTLTTPAVGGSSQLTQVLVINITYLPLVSTYGIYRTTADGGNFTTSGSLSLGENYIAVPPVDFNRTVKILFSNDAIEFDVLTVNGIVPMPPTNTQGLGEPISASNYFAPTTNSTIYAASATLATTAEGASSQGGQTLVINITYLPPDSTYGIYRTTANGGNFTTSGSLIVGENTITVPAVGFDRTVRILFSNDAIEFDALTVNGVVPMPATNTPGIGQAISASGNYFAPTTNSTIYAASATLATTAEGASSQGGQTLVINITYLPPDSTYGIYRTTANGGNFTTSGSLIVGENTITVPAVGFDRTVRILFSNDAIEFDALTVNGTAQWPVDTSGVVTDISSQGGVFDSTTDPTWVSVTTLTTKEEGVASQATQTLIMNVTSLPVDGVSYRIYKTYANGNGDFGSAKALYLGINTITVPSVGFDRSVKIQFDSDAFGFNTLSANGQALWPIDTSGSKVTLANSNLFNSTTDPAWVTALTTAVRQDGASSQNAQTVVMNVTTLLAGANYRVVKTVSNGTWYAADSQALSLGPNTITVNSVAFDRNVKIQFSSDAVEFNALSVNGTDRVIGADEVVVPSVSIDGNTLSWTQTDGTTLQFSDDLESWTSLPSATSPYSPSTSPDRFYRTISEEE
jgi:hypothetical protein